MNPSDGVRCRWDEYEAARERFLSRFEARRGARPSGARAPEPDPEMLDALPLLRVEAHPRPPPAVHRLSRGPSE